MAVDSVAIASVVSVNAVVAVIVAVVATVVANIHFHNYFHSREELQQFNIREEKVRSVNYEFDIFLMQYVLGILRI